MADIGNNKEIARRFLQLVEEGNVEELCEMILPDWTMLGGPPGLPQGPEGMRILFGTFGKVEQKWTIDDMVSEGDKVAVRATNACLQESFLGIPGGGRTQIFTAMFFFSIADGKIAQTWRNADDLGRVLQLGAKLVPPGT